VHGKDFRDLAQPMREVGALLDASGTAAGAPYNHLLCLARPTTCPPAGR